VSLITDGAGALYPAEGSIRRVTCSYSGKCL